jgi:DNA-binding HxlR family transcriptional regulator
MKAPPTDPTSPATGCPLTAALSAIGGKWNMICLYWLSAAPRRFGELRRLMPEISHKVLAETLRDLEREGLIARNVHANTPANTPSHVEYRLSVHGETTAPLIEAVRQWGRRHLDRARAAQTQPGRRPDLAARTE